MGGTFTPEEGRWAVESARRVVEAWLKEGKIPRLTPPPSLDCHGGVFVTLNTYPDGKLRGCIGYPLPVFRLSDALAKAAQSATMDPRFPPLREEEVARVTVEVSLLTEPVKVEAKSPEDLVESVKVGRDGLIASFAGREGLLLPQVAMEYGWTPEEFISQTCWKAGLPPDTWRMPGFTLMRFQAEVFCEETPGGEVTRKELL